MAEAKPIGILDHIEELRRRVKRSFLTVMVLFGFFLAFEARVGDLGGVGVPYPWPDPIHPLASQFFNMTLEYLKPPYVDAIVTSPTDAIMVQFKVAFFLALFAGMPMIAYQMGMFVGPGLRDAERRLVFRLLVPAVLLFATGVLVAFFLVLPFTFSFLYAIAVGLGAQPLLHVNDFLDFVLLFMLGFGLAFEVPVVMYGLTAVGLVRAATWRKYWRFAAIAIAFFGVVITPDGSGITMLLVAAPMWALYAAGYVACKVHERRKGLR